MDAGDRLTLVEERVHRRLVIRVVGDLDYAGAPKLAEAVLSAIADGTDRCALDLSRVEYIDSEALRTLVLLRRELQQKNKTLEALDCSEQVARILRLVDFDGLLHWLKGPEPGVQS